MEPNQRQSIIFFKTHVTVEDILHINPSKPIQFIRCTDYVDMWASIIQALAKLPFRTINFTDCHFHCNHNKRFSLAELALSKLQNISSLTISGCVLNQGTISAISQLTNLTELNIGENATVKLPLQDIECKQQRKLSIIYTVNLLNTHQLPVQHNLESIFDSVPNLTELSIENRAFKNKELKSIQKLKNLTKLKITGTFEQGQWFSCICSLKNLIQLTIYCQYQAFVMIPIKQFDQIQNLKYLKKLVLSSKSRSYKRYILDLGIANTISALPNVTDLDLSHNQLGDDGLKQLSKMKSLQFLKLDHNPNITQYGLAFLQNFLNLQYLSLENEYHNSTSSIDADGAAHLSKLVNVKKLYLNNNRIGDEGAKHISKMHSLRELYLDNNDIFNYGVPALCRIPNLEVLSLNINKIGNYQVWELSKLTKLRKISLNYCKFNTVDKLYKMASLRQLVFSNRIDGDRVRACKIQKPQLKVQIQVWRG